MKKIIVIFTCFIFSHAFAGTIDWVQGSHSVYGPDYISNNPVNMIIKRNDAAVVSLTGAYADQVEAVNYAGYGNLLISRPQGGANPFVLSVIDEDESKELIYPNQERPVPNSERILDLNYRMVVGRFTGKGSDVLLIPSPDRRNRNDPVIFIASDSDESGKPKYFNMEGNAHLRGELLLGIEQAIDVVVEDLNDDGLDDLIIRGNKYAFSLGDGSFSPIFNGYNCNVAGEKDTDCDGVIDIEDDFPLNPNEQIDTDGDGIGNNTDTDDDGDGIDDSIDGASGKYKLDPLNGVGVGEIRGHESVSQAGKFGYSVPLVLLPGAGDVVPKLALEYAQDSGNGILGMGWHITGLSKIERCKNTYAQHGYVHAVNYDESDRYCLNGHMLISINGEYGSNLTEYRTELESYSRIISYGSDPSGTGPNYFKVWRKDGLIETYGGAANQRKLTTTANVTNAVHTWGLSKVEDRFNNFASYQYEKSNNRFDIKSIEYSGHTTKEPSASVVFNYEVRDDEFTGYADNVITAKNYRLKSIKISRVSDTRYKQYNFQYIYGAYGRSLLSQLQECSTLSGGEASCKNKTEFTWNTAAANESKFTNAVTATDSLGSLSTYNSQQQLVGDVDGDGIADLVWTYINIGTIGWKVYKGQSNGGFAAVSVDGSFSTGTAGLGDTQRHSFMLGDVDGDGKADLVWAANYLGSIKKAIFLGGKQNSVAFDEQGVVSTDEGGYYSKDSFFLVDVNADGRQDLLYLFINPQNNKLGYSVSIIKTVNNKKVFDRVGYVADAVPIGKTLHPASYHDQSFAVGDINGDGKVDFVFAFTYGSGQTQEAYQASGAAYRAVFLANGSGNGFNYVSLAKDSYNYIEHDVVNVSLADINNDGKSDFIYTYLDTSAVTNNATLKWRIYYSDIDGTSFGIVKENKNYIEGCGKYSNMPAHSNKSVQFVDINGDGFSDLVYGYREGTASSAMFKWAAYLDAVNKGATVNDPCPASSAGSHNVAATGQNHNFIFSDISGDGKADLLHTYNDGSNLKRAALTQEISYPERLQRITTGLGVQTEVTYKFMTDPTVYTKDKVLNYPFRVDSGQSYVVSQVRVRADSDWKVKQYTYKNAINHLLGRGFLGFEEMSVRDVTKGTIVASVFSYQYPFMGRVLSEIEKDGSTNVLLSAKYNHWATSKRQYAANRETDVVYLADSVLIDYETSGNASLSAKLAIYAYDNDHGNLITESVYIGKGFSAAKIGSNFTHNNFFAASDILSYQGEVVTSSHYDNQLQSWRMGLLTEKSVSYKRPSAADVNHTSVYIPFSDDKFAYSSVTEFVGTNVEKSTSYWYDEFGNVISESTVAAGVAGAVLTTYGEYIEGLYPSSKTNALGQTEHYVYDFNHGLIAQRRDVNGKLTKTSYDAFGNITEVREHNGSRVLHRYTFLNEMINGNSVKYKKSDRLINSSISGDGRPERIEYFDSLGRVIRTQHKNIDGLLVNIDVKYDLLGREIERTQPYFTGEAIYKLVRTFDKKDRYLTELEPDGGLKTYGYSIDANYAGKVDVVSTVLIPGSSPSTKVITSQILLNSFGEMVKSIDGLGIETAFAYDAKGNITETKVNNNEATKIIVSYDVAGNKTSLLDPDAGLITYTNDGLGRVTEELHAGEKIVTAYDALSRIVAKSYIDNASNTLQYNWQYDGAVNGVGLISQISGPDYQKTVQYDAFSRIKAESVAVAGSAKQFTYDYDAFDRITNKTWPSGVSINYRYSPTGYLQGLMDAEDQKVLWSLQSMDAYGNYTGELLGNGLTTSKQFNPANGLADSIVTVNGLAVDAIQQLNYVFDSAGNLYQRSSNHPLWGNISESFTYDNGHRLTSSTTAGAITRNVTYGYDPLGNLLNKSDVGSYTYSPTRPHAVITTAGTVNRSLTYDAKGNVIQSGAQSLTYNVFNLPTAILSNDYTLHFTYGPDEKLLTQRAITASGEKNTIYYAEDYEEITVGAVTRSKTTVNGIFSYDGISTSGSGAKSSDVFYLHKDHLDSIESITDASGSLKTRMLFDPHGSRRKHDGHDADVTYAASLFGLTFETTNKGYTGHEQLDVAGLVHMVGRIYDPVLGRFLSPDNYVQFPELSQSYNRYSYVLNNPLSHTDPSGELIPLLIGGAIIVNRAYSAYDTAMTAKNNIQILADNNASGAAKVQAGLELAGSLVGGKYGRQAVTQAHIAVKSADNVKSAQRIGNQSKAADKAAASGSDRATMLPAETGNRVSMRADTQGDVAKGAKRGPKTDPDAPHNAKIREIADQIEADGGTIIAGGGRKELPERLIPTAGGHKNGRRPDILYEDCNGNMCGVNVGRTKADGSPVTREQKALEDLNGPGQLPTRFERYD